TAVDIAGAALDRAREQAARLEPAAAAGIDWIEADLTSWTPPAGRFGLVTAHYVHPAGPRDDLSRRLAAAVAPGGILLIVDHRPPPHGHGHGHGHGEPQVHVTAEELAATLDPSTWSITTDSPTRTVAGPPGHDRTLYDSVLRARRLG
ncbi:class I SAM-dependent methyltransferase, partial [Actinocorallia lasiicapitis]